MNGCENAGQSRIMCQTLGNEVAAGLQAQNTYFSVFFLFEGLIVKLRNSSMNSREEIQAGRPVPSKSGHTTHHPSFHPFEECPANDKNRTFYNEFNSHPASVVIVIVQGEGEDQIYLPRFRIWTNFSMQNFMKRCDLRSCIRLAKPCTKLKASGYLI